MQKKYKILIVDDDPLNVDLLKEYLEEKYLIKSVFSGFDALSMISTFRPDLILLDIVMPQITGYEVCSRIRKDSRYSFIKIILMSGKASLTERLQGYEVGADDYVTKPFVMEELEAKIKVFLQLKRSEEVDQIKDQLLQLFSHETRTPLNGILGLTDILQADESLDDEAREIIKMISESGNKLFDFVKKTALLCSLKNGLEIVKTKDYLKKNLENVILKFKKSDSNKNISFQINIKDDFEFDLCWSLVNKVIGYIIHNAVKFSGENSRVIINLKKINARCLLEILDQGKGIEPERINCIFDEFAVTDIFHHQQGQGLSLAISKHIMELHEGDIQIESELGVGTKVSLIFPLK